jgi:integrase/recombinase XerD
MYERRPQGRFMLTLYRRHRRTCEHIDRYLKTDRHFCPVWAEGTVEGIYMRRSLKTGSWKRAEELKRSLLEGNAPTKLPSIELALDTFMAEQKARGVSEATQRKIGPLASTLRAFCTSHCLTKLAELDLNHLRLFRASWKDSPISAVKKLERLRSMFNFFILSGWATSNPARLIKNPVVTDPPTLPFSDEEVQAILKHAIGKWRVLALVLLHSGLRIGDAMKLKPDELQDGTLFLYMQKTRVPVRVPLPDFLVHELGQLPLTGGYYFWNRNGESKLATATGNARRTFRKLFKAAGLKGHAHPHRLRDTFAVRLLRAGVPLQDVSILLGHSSVKITERHYAPWVQERQTRLEEMVRRTFKTQLVRVK